MLQITEGFIQQAQQHPEKSAVFIRAQAQSMRSCSYGDLLKAAQRVARAIVDLTEPEFDFDRDGSSSSRSASDPKTAPIPLDSYVCVGLLLPNSIEFLEIILGVAMAGGVSIVLDPKWTLTQIQQTLQRYPIKLLLVDARLLPHLVELPPTISIVVLQPLAGGNGEDRLSDYSQWKDSCPNHDRLLFMPPRPIAEIDPFYVGFTSGTTGCPKGVIRSHRSWVSSFTASQIAFGTHASDRILVPGSLVHSLSLYAALECLNAGATLYLLPQFSTSATLDCLQTQDITMLVAVPALLKTIAKVATHRKQTYRSPRVVIAGGSKLNLDLRTELPHVFPDAEILEYFGALELSFISFASSRQPAPPKSVGQAFQGVTISIRQQDGAEEAAVGEVGWIGVKSPMLSLGYFGLQDAAGYRIVDGWATVGDLGWQDAEGYLYLVGREQDMLVSSGVNVYPDEIEAALSCFPEIDEVAVFGISDAARGQTIAAAIRWTGKPLTRSELQRQLQEILPRQKCPRYFFTVERFPRTHSGKIIRAALQEQILGSLKS